MVIPVKPSPTGMDIASRYGATKAHPPVTSMDLLGSPPGVLVNMWDEEANTNLSQVLSLVELLVFDLQW